MKSITSIVAKFIFIFSFFLFTNISYSQVQNPVQWKWEQKQISSDEVELLFTATIGKGWHIYAMEVDGLGPIPTSFSFTKSKNFEILEKATEVTKPHVAFDSSFGIELGSFEKKAIFSQKVKIKSTSDFELKGSLEFMSCNNITCLSPKEVDFSFQIKGKALSGQSETISYEPTVSSDSGIATVNIDTIKTETVSAPIETIAIEKDSLWRSFWIAFGWGLLALLMPCVFPLIPMTVSFFLKNGDNKTKSKINALFFSSSIVVIFLIIGLPVSLLLGASFANELSTHWALNIPLFLIFMLFAASFFGMFEIMLPASWVNYADKKSDKGGLIGPFFMALTTVLVSFSCTVPIVGAVLFSSSHGDFSSAIIKMLGFAMAVAVPFGLFAFFPRFIHSMPKSGSWMNTLKVILGFLELALGLKFLSIVDLTYHWHILDRDIFIALWIVIFSLMGLYLLGKIRFAHDSETKHIGVPRLIFAILTFSFVVYLIPGMLGAPLKMLSGYLPPITTQSFNLNTSYATQNTQSSVLCEKPKHSEFLKIPLGLEGYFDYDQALQCSREKKKPLFIDFTGHGCANCRKMEENVWTDPKVMEILRNDFIIVSLYVDDKTTLPQEEWFTSKLDGKLKKTIGKKWSDFILSRYQINAQPYYVIVGDDEKLLVEPKGLDLNIDHFILFLNEAKKEYQKSYK